MVIDCFSRRVVGWSIADHIRSELVVDALQMAIWNRRPPAGTVHHSDHGWTTPAGSSDTSYATPACSDRWAPSATASTTPWPSFFATLQTKLLDRSTWPTREAMVNAIFSFVEGFYNPRRGHSTLGYLSPADCETQHASKTPVGPPSETAA